jgi:hypothetical protein
MRFLLPVFFLAFGVGAVPLITSVVRGRQPGPLFAALWLAVFGWNAYWWLFRVCTEVRVGGGRLAWRTPLRRGEVATTDVSRIRPSRGLQRQMAVVELHGRRPLLVPVRYGFERLTGALTDGVPGLRVDP